LRILISNNKRELQLSLHLSRFGTLPRFTPPTTANQPANVLQPLSGGQETQDQYEDSSENQQGLTLQTLLRQTGLGIKVRFLLALTLIALFPALILVSGAARAYGHWLVWAYRSFCLRPGTSRLCSQYCALRYIAAVWLFLGLILLAILWFTSREQVHRFGQILAE